MRQILKSCSLGKIESPIRNHISAESMLRWILQVKFPCLGDRGLMLLLLLENDDGAAEDQDQRTAKRDPEMI